MNPSDITLLIQASRGGNRAALDALMERVYPELKRIAINYLAGQPTGSTLQPTALLHEAYIKLAASAVDWQDRGHFFAVSAAAMRQILVDYARAKNSQKRGSGAVHVAVEDAFAYQDSHPETLLSLDAALNKLAVTDHRKVQILELRYFAGLSVEEISDAVGVGLATVGRDLRFAEAWLKRELAA